MTNATRHQMIDLKVFRVVTITNSQIIFQIIGWAIAGGHNVSVAD